MGQATRRMDGNQQCVCLFCAAGLLPRTTEPAEGHRVAIHNDWYGWDRPILARCRSERQIDTGRGTATQELGRCLRQGNKPQTGRQLESQRRYEL